MRARRRHELKTNVLYAWLSKARVWAEARKGLVFVLCLVILGVSSIVYLWIRRTVGRPREAWALLSTSGTEEQYSRLIEDYGATRAAQEGRLLWASLLFERKLYTQAREHLDRVLADAGEDAYLGARALWGLATLAEQQRRVADAIRLYRTIAQRYPAPGFLEQAEARVEALQSAHRPTAPPEAFAPLPADWPRTRPATRAATKPATRPWAAAGAAD